MKYSSKFISTKLIRGFFPFKSSRVRQGSHSTWKTWKNESTPEKPGNVMEF